ncbi:SDR family NAD(P)-dependent oxidoreductase [Aridibaculum aurantiacum]|uniref:SDR family NAD(P)-dependent oxidoreductase n=1 Tax=Aridibaculum aurantiacum TaxID=2810307 RepID=UPI001A961F59|nr:SDR family oxidoreductase [Aridibaculum aurantiacum]
MATEKQTALITGASSGFGYEFAKLFAKDGYDVILVSRNGEKLQDVAQEIKMQYNVRAIVIEKDLAEPGAAVELYHEVQKQHTQVDVLVNNAGVGEHGFFTDTDMDKELFIINLNVIALMQLTKLFLQDMVARDSGKILQLASTASLAPLPLMAVYSGTKAFVYSFSQALINELKDTNVTMTVLLPGASDTDFFHKAHAEDTVIYNDTSLSDPADVAKDGYEALMKGKDKIVSGLKNKVQAAMTNVVPDSALSSGMRHYMEESSSKDKKEEKGSGGKEKITDQETDSK